VERKALGSQRDGISSVSRHVKWDQTEWWSTCSAIRLVGKKQKKKEREKAKRRHTCKGERKKEEKLKHIIVLREPTLKTTQRE
jgi:hypothetical protein